MSAEDARTRVAQIICDAANAERPRDQQRPIWPSDYARADDALMIYREEQADE